MSVQGCIYLVVPMRNTGNSTLHNKKHRLRHLLLKSPPTLLSVKSPWMQHPRTLLRPTMTFIIPMILNMLKRIQSSQDLRSLPSSIGQLLMEFPRPSSALLGSLHYSILQLEVSLSTIRWLESLLASHISRQILSLQCGLLEIRTALDVSTSILDGIGILQLQRCSTFVLTQILHSYHANPKKNNVLLSHIKVRCGIQEIQRGCVIIGALLHSLLNAP